MVTRRLLLPASLLVALLPLAAADPIVTIHNRSTKPWTIKAIEDPVNDKGTITIQQPSNPTLSPTALKGGTPFTLAAGPRYSICLTYKVRRNLITQTPDSARTITLTDHNGISRNFLIKFENKAKPSVLAVKDPVVDDRPLLNAITLADAPNSPTGTAVLTITQDQF